MKILRPSYSDYLNLKTLIKLNMKKEGANTDMLRLQQQIMQNSQGIQDYMQDLNSWMGDMNKNEKTVT
jgi:hypothetical protein